MYIYNITVNIDPAIENDWTALAKEGYIPSALATGLVKEAELIKVLHAQEVQQGLNFTIQLRMESLKDIDTFKKEYEKTIEAPMADAFSGKYLTFRLVLRSLWNQKG